MIDMHSHILWDIDDGARSREESLSMATIALEEGIDTIVATPHCIDEIDLEGFAKEVRERCKSLQKVLNEREISIKIVPGAEIYMDLDILNRPGLDRLTIGEHRYILVEMPMGQVPRYAEDFLYHLLLKGFIPIIAHPERNRQIIEHPNILARFIDLGSLTQINTGSISGFFGPKIQECARILITHNMAHMLGTDAHSNRRRGPYIKQAVEHLYSWLDKDRAERIIYHNPNKVLKGDILTVDSPMEYRPRKGIFSIFKRR
ncbi:MAG: CpsB/CapC family capsule biosynthesis tyrosine phosphatase [Caldicoprobacterales bacterium]